MKVALYARVSTSEQDATQQIEDCRSINLDHNYAEGYIFVENQSAWKDNKDRPEFERLLKLIKARQVDHLLVWDLDRLYRNRQKLIEFFRLCKAYHCQVHSYRQAWLDEINKIPQPWGDMMFDLMLNVMGWIAEEESNKKSDRVKKATRQVDGQTMSYKGNKWGRKGVSTYKKNLLAEIVAKNPGVSVRQLAKELNLSVGAVHKYLAEFRLTKTELQKGSSFNPLMNTEGLGEDARNDSNRQNE